METRAMEHARGFGGAAWLEGWKTAMTAARKGARRQSGLERSAERAELAQAQAAAYRYSRLGL